MWQLRLLGRLEVLSPEASPISFRTRKVGSLLSFLALNRGKPVSNHTLQDILWPEADGDRQAQSLRKAVSDLRDVLDGGSAGDSVIGTSAGSCSLNVKLIDCDADRFEKLISRDGGDNLELRFAEAIGLYGGPLLAPMEDDWVHAYRRQYEEMYCGAVLDYCERLVEMGDHGNAIRIGCSAIVLAPMREEGYVASIRAHAAMGNQAAALLQLEALEKVLDYHFGETPSKLAYDALETPVTETRKTTQALASPENSGRATKPTHVTPRAFYVEREADQQVTKSLSEGESVILIFGPRQTGKTSLISRAASKLRIGGTKVVVTDFQSLNKTEVDRVQTFYRALVYSFAKQLGFEYEPSWSEWTGPNSNLDDAIDGMLRIVDEPICWAMDEVDRLFGTDYSDDFFGLVRSWHNRRALDPDGPWQHLTLLISYATEAHLFISDLNQSPFNVGQKVSLRDLSYTDVAVLALQMGVEDVSVAESVYEITRGHPFLTQRALKFLSEGKSLKDLHDNTQTDDGIFADHLRRLTETTKRNTETTIEVKRLLNGEPFLDQRTGFRLWAAGLIEGAKQDGAKFRVPIYEQHLRTQLGDD